jgi:hypothetical protein
MAIRTSIGPVLGSLLLSALLAVPVVHGAAPLPTHASRPSAVQQELRALLGPWHALRGRGAAFASMRIDQRGGALYVSESSAADDGDGYCGTPWPGGKGPHHIILELEQVSVSASQATLRATIQQSGRTIIQTFVATRSDPEPGPWRLTVTTRVVATRGALLTSQGSMSCPSVSLVQG